MKVAVQFEQASDEAWLPKFRRFGNKFDPTQNSSQLSILVGALHPLV
jgi:hypothetical protein